MILLYGMNQRWLKEKSQEMFPGERTVYTDTWAVAKLLLDCPGSGIRTMLVRYSLPIGEVSEDVIVVRV